MRLKSFRKYITVIVGIWLAIIIAGLVLSHSIQGKIIEILSAQTSKHLTTEIHIRKNDIHFSIFKKFPLASVELRNVCVKVPETLNIKGKNLEKGDTLLYAKSIYLQLDLKSVLKETYQLEKIQIKNGFLQIITDSNGNSSLDIVRKGKTNDTANFTTDINSLIINDLYLYSNDFKNDLSTETYIKQGNASGRFTKSNFLVALKGSGKIVKYKTKGQASLLNYSFLINSEVELSNKKYTINRGAFNLSNIPFTVIGSIAPEDKTLVDLVFSAKSVPIKQIDKNFLHGFIGPMGLVPKSGNVNIRSTIIGRTSLGMPAIKATYLVTKGSVYDSKHKITFEDIYLAGHADNGYKHLPATTTIYLDTFNLRIGNSQQSGTLKISNILEPRLSISTKGIVHIQDVLPLIEIPNISFVEGSMKNNLAFAGKIRKNVKEGEDAIDKLQIWGDFSLNELGIVLENYKIPYVVLSGNITMNKDFSLVFENLRAKSGHSDVNIDGELYHVIKKDGIARFNGKIKSDYFLTDDFVTPASSKDSKSKPVDFPDSLIINSHIFIKNFTFGKFSTQNINGNFSYQTNKLSLTPFSMDAFNGKINGNLSIQQNESSGNIKMIAKSRVSDVDIHKLFEGCNNFSQDIISGNNLGGNISGNISFSSVWTDRLQLIPEELTNISEIIIINGELINYQPLMGLSKFIDVEELKNIKFNKLETSITIENEKVALKQTNISSSAISFEGSGMHGFDNKYEYRLQLGLSDVLWRKAKNKKKNITEFGYIVDDGVGHTILPIILSGKGTSYNVKLDKKTARSSIKEKLVEEKKELKNLFKPNNGVEEKAKESLTKEKSTEKPKLEKTDTGTYQVKTSERTIIWDDSEDDDSEE